MNGPAGQRFILHPSSFILSSSSSFQERGLRFRQRRLLGESVELRAVFPILELLHVEIQIAPVVCRQLVRLRRQPDRLWLRRAGLFAERAEHTPLDVDVVTVENLNLLLLAVLLENLIVNVDIDDVDRARYRAQLAADAAVVGKPDHSPTPVPRPYPLPPATHPPL